MDRVAPSRFCCVVRYRLSLCRSKFLPLIRLLAEQAARVEECDGMLSVWIDHPDGLSLLERPRTATIGWKHPPEWSLDGVTFSTQPISLACLTMGEVPYNQHLIWPSGDIPVRVCMHPHDERTLKQALECLTDYS